MKTLTLLLALSAFAASAQTIRIADNNPNAPSGPNIYNLVNASPNPLQKALDDSAPGDIVYVQPSLTIHPEVTIQKRVTLRGIGFNTGRDLATFSRVRGITLSNLVDGTANSSGTIIEGIEVAGVPGVSWGQLRLGLLTGSFGYTLRNITIRNCAIGLEGLFRASGYMPAENITVENCATGITFSPTGTVTNLLVYRSLLYRIQIQNGSLSSAIFSNNFVINLGDPNSNFFGLTSGGAPPTNISSLLISNNNFLGQNNVASSRFMRNDLTDAIVSNNIFYGMAPLGATGGGVYERNAFSNNLTFGTSNDALPPTGTGVGNTGSNNKPGENPLFVNAPFNTSYVETMDFTLQAGSPADNAGTDGTDIGITGGGYPIDKNFSLRPTNAPVIQQFNPVGVVPQNQPLKANIKVKSN